MMRRVVRDLPAIKWRDQKIEEWRGLARQNKEALRAAEQRAKAAEAELARVRSGGAGAGAASKQGGGATGRVVSDQPGSAPRADWDKALVQKLVDAGHEPTVGAARTDPRGYPSFVTHLFEARRYRKRLGDQGLKNHPRREIPKKLQNFALAASHGVQPPTIHAIWTRKEDIDLSSLPETFVIKSNGGAGSRGVYPLRRVAGEKDLYEITDETRRRISGTEVVTNLTTDPKLTGPWFAEELLVPDVGDSALPSDIKIYAFYGQIGYGFTRRAPLHRGATGWQDKLEFRYFDGQGEDIEMREEASRRDIPVTPHLQEMLEQAKVLSAAVPLPFVRVDLYGTTKGIVMGELTLLPGGNQYYLTEQDARLGKMWEEAEMRLQIDVAVNGRPYAIVAGDHPVPENLRPYLPATSAARTARPAAASAPQKPARSAPAAAAAAAPELPCGEPLLGQDSIVTRDDAGTTPRVEFAPDLVKALAKEGHVPSSGTTPGDPRGYGSFATHLLEARRYRMRLGDQGLKNHPRREIPKKLQNFALAASHGVQPPVLHAVWRTAEEIDLSGLPDEFVMKSNGGAGSRGVYPLRRVAGESDLYEVTDDTRRRITGDEVIRNLTTDPKLTGPWFAEELLVPEGGEGGLPSDIKMFAFYGEVGFGFARRAPMHRGAAGWQDAQQFRYFDGEGRDIEMRTRRSVRDVPLSPQLQQMLEHARVLSAAVPLPFVRVDMYGTPKGVVMGEITLLPGSHTDLLPLQDMRLGRMWEEAEMRFQIDVAVKGRPYAILAGDHPVPENLKPYLPKKA